MIGPSSVGPSRNDGKSAIGVTGAGPRPVLASRVDVKSTVAEVFAAPHAGWLSPIDEQGDGYEGVATRRRASDAGPLPISLETHTEIVDGTRRQLRADKRGAIPEDLATILDRLGLRTEAWRATVTNFGKWFGEMVGKAAAMKESAARAGVRSWGGMKYCRLAFKQSSSTGPRLPACSKYGTTALGRIQPRTSADSLPLRAHIVRMIMPRRSN